MNVNIENLFITVILYYYIHHFPYQHGCSHFFECSSFCIPCKASAVVVSLYESVCCSPALDKCKCVAGQKHLPCLHKHIHTPSATHHTDTASRADLQIWQHLTLFSHSGNFELLDTLAVHQLLSRHGNYIYKSGLICYNCHWVVFISLNYIWTEINKLDDNVNI